MIRGTTPTHEFTIPFDVSLIDDLRISYEQLGEVKLEKSKKDCVLEGNTIAFTLTQEETLLFLTHANVKLQVRVKTTDGNVLTSEIIKLSVGQCINDEVL